jgi:hypothetical protein
MLSDEQRSEFFEDGYLILRSFYSISEVAEMAAAFKRLEHQAHRLTGTQYSDGALFVIQRTGDLPMKIERIVWCGAAEPVLAELGQAPKLLGAVGALLGTTVFDQLINQAHIKRPGDGVEFGFHQDSYHRRYGTPLFRDVNGRGSFVQALTAVDAMAPDNGGLWVIPRSHRAGHLPTSDGSLPESAVDARAAVPMMLEPGDTLLLSPFTVHGSRPNLGHSPRRVFINGFCCPGANQREYPGAGTGVRRYAPLAKQAVNELQPRQGSSGRVTLEPAGVAEVQCGDSAAVARVGGGNPELRWPCGSQRQGH